MEKPGLVVRNYMKATGMTEREREVFLFLMDALAKGARPSAVKEIAVAYGLRDYLDALVYVIAQKSLMTGSKP